MKDKPKTLMPKLRFPEFKDGPAWEEKALKDVCEVNPQSNGLPESFVYIDLESVEGGALLSRKRIEQKDAPSRAQRLLNNGDVVFQIVRPYQRNNLFVQFNDGQAYVASTGYAQLRAYESDSFLYQLVHTDTFVDKVIAKCTGSSYPAINSNDLAEVPVFVPKPAEQRKIAACLTSLDEWIAAEGRKLEALRTHKKGLMQQLFPREGETRPRLRLFAFRKAPAWEPKALGQVLLETPRPIDMIDNADYSLVTVKRRYGGVVSRGVMKGKAILVKSQFLVYTDDFLISKRQIVHDSCGLVPAVLEGSVVSNEYCVMTPKPGYSIHFFNYFVQQPCVSRSFLQASVGIVIEKMLFKLESWLKMEFLFPSFEEQQQIAVCLSSLDALISAQSRKLNSLRTHKKGIMQQLFPSPEGV